MRFRIESRAVLLRIVIVVTVASALAPAQTLQRALTLAMRGHSGAAVVLSVDKRELLATYDPQAVANRVALPGSAIKPFVLLAMLRSGAITTDTQLVCRRQVRVGGHDLDCRHVRTVEAMNAERALAYSCNSYFTEMASRLTDVQLTQAFREAGFGSPTHLVRSEDSGNVRRVTTHAELQLSAVGEDGIYVTPLQMAAAYRVLAREARSNDPAVQTVLAGMRGAVDYGTAQGAQAPTMQIAGKTGTSTAGEGAWTHAWFAGFAPASNPQVIVVIFLERGHGSDAAEIAGQVFVEFARQRKQDSAHGGVSTQVHGADR